MFYILHGDDEFGLSEKLAELRLSLTGDDPAMAELNTSFLDGNRVTISELRHVCDSIPFMAAHRLVIVRGLLDYLVPSKKDKRRRGSQAGTHAAKQAFLKDLTTYLPELPPSTQLIFVEDQKLRPSHPILRVAQTAGGQQASIEVRELPKQEALPGWIQQQARKKGGSFSHEASRRLAALIGRDLRLLDQEVEKLLLYADGRQVEPTDMEKLVSVAREANIFDLVDCVGRRQTNLALRHLHRMLEEGAEPLYLLSMLARQVRILIQVSELYEQRLPQAQIAKRIKQHPFVVEKAQQQTRNFSLDQLTAAHQELVDTDWMIKTGKLEPVVALDMLVVDLTRV